MTRRGPLVVLLLLLPAWARAAPLTLRSGRVTVYYDEAKQRALAERTAAALDEAHRQAVQRLGFGLPERATAVLCPTPEAFQRETRTDKPHLILGMAIPSRRVLFLNCARAEAETPNAIKVILTHEVCHLVFGEIKRRTHERIPRWFEEGTAVWFSGVLPFIHRGRLAAAAEARSLIPFSKLESQFPKSEAALRLAYEQSEDVLLFVIGRTGPDVVRRILARIDAGASFPQAVASVVGRPLEDVLSQWREQVYRQHSWIRRFLRRMPISLWSLLAVAVMLLFLRYRLYRRRKLEEWRREEAEKGEVLSDTFEPMEETDDRWHPEGD